MVCETADVLAGSVAGRCAGWLAVRPRVCRQRVGRQGQGFLHATRLRRLTVRSGKSAVVDSGASCGIGRYEMTARERQPTFLSVDDQAWQFVGDENVGRLIASEMTRVAIVESQQSCRMS